MRGAILLGGSVLTLAALASARQDDALAAAAQALGANTIGTLQFSGAGATFSVGQNVAPGDQWPRVTVKSYTARIDYETASMQLELVRDMGAVMPRGGGVPFTGEVRQMQAMSGPVAWNVPVPANPAAGSLPASLAHRRKRAARRHNRRPRRTVASAACS
jgi:hypothetical protein